MRELEPSLGRFAFLTRWHLLHLPCGVCNGPFISPDSNHSSRNSTFSKQHFSPRDDQHMAKSLRVHSLIARAALHSRASAGCNFGQTAGPSLIKFGTREGGREGGRGGEGGEGREGRAGQGRAGEGRGGEGKGREGRGGEGRGGEGRGGEGRLVKDEYMVFRMRLGKNNFILFKIPVFLDIFQNNLLIWAFQFKCLSSVMPRKLN